MTALRSSGSSFCSCCRLRSTAFLKDTFLPSQRILRCFRASNNKIKLLLSPSNENDSTLYFLVGNRALDRHATVCRWRTRNGGEFSGAAGLVASDVGNPTLSARNCIWERDETCEKTRRSKPERRRKYCDTNKKRDRSSVFPVVQYEFFALLNGAISALSGYYLWPRLCNSTLIIFAYANELAAYWVYSRDSTDLLTEISIGEGPSDLKKCGT